MTYDQDRQERVPRNTDVVSAWIVVAVLMAALVVVSLFLPDVSEEVTAVAELQRAET